MFNRGYVAKGLNFFWGGKKLRSFVSVGYISLKLTNTLRIDHIKKGNNRLPTIHFQRQKREFQEVYSMDWWNSFSICAE